MSLPPESGNLGCNREVNLLHAWFRIGELPHRYLASGSTKNEGVVDEANGLDGGSDVVHEGVVQSNTSEGRPRIGLVVGVAL